MMEILYHILEETLTITAFVIGLMIVIEFINVKTDGLWSKKLQTSPWVQIIIGAFMGIIPGCLGTYTVVSLYVHQVVNFPALIATLIATTGDEAFFMFSKFPGKAALLTAILFALAIIVGGILQFTMKNKFIGLSEKSFPLHDEPECHHHEHRHFLKKHIWEHVIKVHLPKIFFWSLGIITAITLLDTYVDVQEFVSQNMYIVLLLAILIGIIPQSGPHLIFVMLFASGVIPFSILMASSIVQDGHGALPLLAESRKAFLLSKGIKIVLAIAIGIVGLATGF